MWPLYLAVRFLLFRVDSTAAALEQFAFPKFIVPAELDKRGLDK
jgi:hypothetical protein